ncbi:MULTISPECIES: hypothetical protein [unclassified Amycolatopsis]|uniref:hypothetical protein n=1 Tax=unclassified Amycolatopsis TaxID=2618356 RepID=UPI00287665A9|nr:MULTISPECIES: hypothetical protein [unclassified Amycolatopsis]MDS0139492.1 hypothetical protein [Amycolatopsis sp. 505]MDS0147071.1 hypothetical protein [Amycolatopsis sp. CM201R]
MKNPTLRRVLVVTTVVGATLGGGIAVAAWTSSGSGAANAKAGTAAAPTTGTVPASALTTGPLYPGGPVGDAKILVGNPNPYPVKVSTIVANGTPTGANGTGTCTTTGVSWTAQSPNAPVPAGGSTTLTLTGAVSMITASDDGCQGAVFTIPVTVTVVSG